MADIPSTYEVESALSSLKGNLLPRTDVAKLHALMRLEDMVRLSATKPDVGGFSSLLLRNIVDVCERVKGDLHVGDVINLGLLGFFTVDDRGQIRHLRGDTTFPYTLAHLPIDYWAHDGLRLGTCYRWIDLRGIQFVEREGSPIRMRQNDCEFVISCVLPEPHAAKVDWLKLLIEVCSAADALPVVIDHTISVSYEMPYISRFLRKYPSQLNASQRDWYDEIDALIALTQERDSPGLAARVADSRLARLQAELHPRLPQIQIAQSRRTMLYQLLGLVLSRALLDLIWSYC